MQINGGGAGDHMAVTMTPLASRGARPEHVKARRWAVCFCRLPRCSTVPTGRDAPPPRPRFSRWSERANVHEGNEHSPRVSTGQRQAQVPRSMPAPPHSHKLPRASWWFLGA
eukprot:6644151-Pyramimonas_sp.AAC.1